VFSFRNILHKGRPEAQRGGGADLIKE
jgi:hypothetical protein